MIQDLKKWVMSFSGCEGGIPATKTWLCGVEQEFPDTVKDLGEYYKKELVEKIDNNGDESPPDDFDWKKSLTTSNGKSFAKLFKAIHGGKVEDYKSIAENKKIFKLNVYPIVSSSTEYDFWDKYRLAKITYAESKSVFHAWCRDERFPFYLELRKTHKPKLIICIGVDYQIDFLNFFGGKDLGKLETGTIVPQSDKTYYYKKIDGTLLVVIPSFSGRDGLKTDDLLQKMGEKIKDLLK